MLLGAVVFFPTVGFALFARDLVYHSSEGSDCDRPSCASWCSCVFQLWDLHSLPVTLSITAQRAVTVIALLVLLGAAVSQEVGLALLEFGGLWKHENNQHTPEDGMWLPKGRMNKTGHIRYPSYGADLFSPAHSLSVGKYAA